MVEEEPPRRRQKFAIPLGMIAAVVMIVAMGVRSFADAHRDADAMRAVTHSYAVLEALNGLLSGLGGAESALRGYALSKEPAVLTDVAPTMVLTITSLATVAVLVIDDAEQHRRLTAVKPIVQQRLALMTERLRRIRAGEHPGYSPESQALTERIRREVNQMLALENGQLITRRATSERLAVTTMWTLPIASVVAVLLVLIVFGFLSSEMTFRRRSENAVRRRLAEMRVLGHMNELLASCKHVSEAYDVVGRVVPELFAGLSGGISIIRPSRDLIEQQACWGEPAIAASMTPDACWCLRRGHPHRSGSAYDVSCAHFGAAVAHNALCLPLLAHGEVIGTLQLISGNGAIDDDVQRTATVVAENVALAIANLQLRETLRNQSVRDPLTGLFNRRYTEETFARELGRATRTNETVSLLMLDVDHFKRFNDTFGHDAGDLVLKEIAAVLQLKTRGSDVAARLGGEELCVLLPGASRQDALKRAEDIRAAIAALELKHHGTALGRVTTSIGVSCVPEHAATVDEMMRSADAALYRAKHEGRDRVVLAV